MRFVAGTVTAVSNPVDQIAALALEHVGLRRDDTAILRDIDWTVMAGERWVVLGPNGSGKTSLVRIASLWEHPSSGRVRVLGHELGRVDVRPLRAQVGLVSAAMADQLRTDLAVRDVVLTARRGALEPWWHTYDDQDHEATDRALAAAGVSTFATRRFGTLSSGERQRVQMARVLVTDPSLVVFDEPAAGLDLAARQDLLDRLGALATDPASPPSILVTHHVEEIPLGVTHVLALRDGSVLRSGPLADVLTEDTLAATFGLPVHLEGSPGRWRAWTDPR